MPSSQAFRIILYPTQHGNYTTGDIVTGKVVLQSKLDEPVRQATIRFIGQQNIVIGRGADAHNITTTLFNQNLVLYDSHYTLRANTAYEWPFEFVFPDLYRPSIAYADDDTPEPLPPTLYDEDSYVSFLHVCSVRYNLVATLSRPLDTHQTNQYVSKSRLTYVLPPSREPGLGEAHSKYSTESFEIKTSLASTAQERRSSSASAFKQKTSSIFKASSFLSSYSFELIVKTFDHICFGQSMPLSVSVRRLSATSDDYVAPVVSLKKIWTTVRGITTVLIRDGVQCGAEGLKCDSRFTHDERHGQGFNPFLEECDYTKIFALDILWSTATVPTFSRANISRIYKLKLEFTITCAGKTLKMEVQHPLTVIPEPPSGDRTVPETRIDAEVEPPPAYTIHHILSEPLPNYQESSIEECRIMRNQSA